MDDDKEKSAIEKMIDKVNDAVENIANTASALAMKAPASKSTFRKRPTRRPRLLRYLPPPLRRSERCRRRRP